MYNENYPAEYDEIVPIEVIKFSSEKIIEVSRVLAARRREYTMGIVVNLNHKNELVSGYEWLLLAVQNGQESIKVKRSGPITLKNNF
jgi:hypothetical protein